MAGASNRCSCRWPRATIWLSNARRDQASRRGHDSARPARALALPSWQPLAAAAAMADWESNWEPAVQNDLDLGDFDPFEVPFTAFPHCLFTAFPLPFHCLPTAFPLLFAAFPLFHCLLLHFHCFSTGADGERRRGRAAGEQRDLEPDGQALGGSCRLRRPGRAGDDRQQGGGLVSARAKALF